MQSQLLSTFDRLAALGRLRARRLAKKTGRVGRLSQGQPTHPAEGQPIKDQPGNSTPDLNLKREGG